MSEPTVHATAAVASEHIKRFQSRAQFHFYISYGVMFLIFILFALCWYIFFRAQDIDRGTSSLELFQELQLAEKYQEAVINAYEKELKGTEAEARVGQRTTLDVLEVLDRLGQAKTKLSVLREKERLMVAIGYYSDVDSVRSKEELKAQFVGMTEARQKLAQLRDRVQGYLTAGEVTETDLAQAHRYIAEIDLKRELLERKINLAPPAAELKSATTNIDTLELIRTSLIRFGGVAVTLFLMSVLVPIYRYNVRLATYYLARADTLILCRDAKVDNFGEMISLLTPVLAFDKEPRTPVDSVASMVKEAASVVKRT